jgi:UDP-N-acetyl-D-mannosaminuronate dehydrogenase
MLQDLRFYSKYIGALESEHGERAVEHFRRVGLKTRVLTPPEATELAKLTETTYFGLLIAWAQEVERYCLELGLDYDDIASIYDEISFFPPVRYFPGVIGGHCVMPNVGILGETFESPLLDAIRWSNAQKAVLEQKRD